jgi:hypothetical protein
MHHVRLSLSELGVDLYHHNTCVHGDGNLRNKVSCRRISILHQSKGADHAQIRCINHFDFSVVLGKHNVVEVSPIR